MAFESIADYIPEIEKQLAKGHSPNAIAKALGIPKKRMTIQRFKSEVFDISEAAKTAWEEEKKRSREERLEEGKARIIDDLEGLNLAKLRGVQLLELDIGDPYKTAGDDATKELSLGSVAIYWDMGTKILTQAVRQSQEIAGDDPESRKADALEGLGEPDLRKLRAILIAEGAGGASQKDE